MTNTRWKAVLALLVVWVAVGMNWSWVWGILFIMWTIPALMVGRTHLVEEVERARNPILYWLIVVTWIFLALYFIAVDLMELL